MAAPGTPWSKLFSQLREHPKTYDLADALGIDQVSAIGHLACMWMWAVDYAPDGMLGRSVQKIEGAAKWKGAVNSWVNGCVLMRWLDVDEHGNHRLHNWFDYNEAYKRAQAKAVKRAKEEPESTVTSRSTSLSTSIETSTATSTPHVQSQVTLRGEERIREEKRGEDRSDRSDPFPEDSITVSEFVLANLPPPLAPNGYQTADLIRIAKHRRWEGTLRLSPESEARANAISARPWTLEEMKWAVQGAELKPPPTNVGILFCKLEDARKAARSTASGNAPRPPSNTTPPHKDAREELEKIERMREEQEPYEVQKAKAAALFEQLEGH